MTERQIIFTNYGLSGQHGTEMFLWDVTRRLQSRGTRCGIFSPRLGPIAEAFRKEGIEVWDNPDEIDWEPDLLHCHHVSETVRILHRFPKTPALFMLHEPRLWQGYAPVTSRIERYVAVDHFCKQRLIREHNFEDNEITVIPNGVDTEKFNLRSPLPKIPRRALIFTSGGDPGKYLDVVRSTCTTLGIHLDEIGPAAGNSVKHPEDILPEYDLVFAKARCALEALCAGCSVIITGAEGFGGIVTSNRFDHFRRMNFGMGLLTLPLTEDSLIAQIKSYDSKDSERVTHRVRTECGVDQTVTALESLYVEIGAVNNSATTVAPQVSLEAAAHISKGITEEAVWLAKNVEHLNQVILDLNHQLEQFRDTENPGAKG
ncbi:MAG: glycosyltransferase [Verrucomicrobiales bacterium]|nr:glycosyltransferase [Verrucomicrobiales bacterium]